MEMLAEDALKFFVSRLTDLSVEVYQKDLEIIALKKSIENIYIDYNLRIEAITKNWKQDIAAWEKLQDKMDGLHVPVIIQNQNQTDLLTAKRRIEMLEDEVRILEQNRFDIDQNDQNIITSLKDALAVSNERIDALNETIETLVDERNSSNSLKIQAENDLKEYKNMYWKENKK